MLMYICLPRLFYLGLRSGLLTGNFRQSPQSWVYVTVDKEDNKALHLPRGATALTMSGLQSPQASLRFLPPFIRRPVRIKREYSVDNRYCYGIIIIPWSLNSIPKRARAIRKNTGLIFAKLKHCGMILI